MVQGAMLSAEDASQLTAFVQSSQESSDSDSDSQEPGAPASAVYQGQTGGIIETMAGLTEKAEAQLDKARKTETTNVQNYQMLKQSLEDEISFANKDMDDAKKGLSESQEKKANAEGDLAVTSADLEEDTKTKATLHSDCMNGAEEFEMSTKSRGEELKALAEAKKSDQSNHRRCSRADLRFQPDVILAGLFQRRPCEGRSSALRQRSSAQGQSAGTRAAGIAHGCGDSLGR